MNPKVGLSRSLEIMLGIAIATLAVGCARANSASSAASQTVERTVLIDTALYRQHCVQADAG